ncbi:MAG: hypothetical protein HQL37_00300 [Alphaproteobacteria bacterium]|nr:hypothetical protein [Alphaproteobacteria bacterium]
MRTTIHYLLLIAMRDRFLVTLAGFLLLAGLVSRFIGDSAIVETNAAALAFAGAAVRLILVVGVVLFVAVHIGRMYDNREMEVLLSRPLSRPQVILGLFLGFFAVALLLAGLAVAAVLIAGQPVPAGLLLWGASLVGETAIMTGVSVYFTLVLRGTITAALISLAFYVLARLIGLMLGMAAGKLALVHGIAGHFEDGMVTAVSVAVPRLDLFAQTHWLVYGPSGRAVEWTILAQTAIYPPLVLAAAAYDFRRRNL